MDSGEKVRIPDDAILTVVEGDDEGKTYTISKKSTILGREEISDFKLSDKYISNRQCQIVFRGGHFTVIDLGSLNKTKVNNKVFVQKNLRDDDVIMIGKTKIRFNWAGQDESELESSDDILYEE